MGNSIDFAIIKVISAIPEPYSFNAAVICFSSTHEGITPNLTIQILISYNDLWYW